MMQFMRDMRMPVCAEFDQFTLEIYPDQRVIDIIPRKNADVVFVINAATQAASDFNMNVSLHFPGMAMEIEPGVEAEDVIAGYKQYLARSSKKPPKPR
jgi:hypothetical protein